MTSAATNGRALSCLVSALGRIGTFPAWLERLVKEVFLKPGAQAARLQMHEAWCIYKYAKHAFSPPAQTYMSSALNPHCHHPQSLGTLTLEPTQPFEILSQLLPRMAPICEPQSLSHGHPPDQPLTLEARNLQCPLTQTRCSLSQKSSWVPCIGLPM